MKQFRVAKFEELQHYKDRSPIWIKLYTRLLENYTFGRLPDAAKAHLIAIWLLASRSKNVLPYDADWIGKRINATEPVDLEILLAFDFIVLLEGSDCVDQDASKPIAKRLPRGEEKREEKISRSARENVSHENFQAEFDAWYQAYPAKRGRGHAWKAYKAARKKTDAGTLLAGAKRYADDPRRDPNFTAYPSTWLNGERWLDGGAAEKPKAAKQPGITIGSPEWHAEQKRLGLEGEGEAA